jgi:hypothetical protein
VGRHGDLAQEPVALTDQERAAVVAAIDALHGTAAAAAAYRAVVQVQVAAMKWAAWPGGCHTMPQIADDLPQLPCPAPPTRPELDHVLAASTFARFQRRL